MDPGPQTARPAAPPRRALLAWCVRVLFVLLTKTIYRMKVLGRANVPATGGALLAPNHVTFVDAVFLIAAIDRPVRFLLDTYWFERPFIRPFVRSMGAIPISSEGGPRAILRALRDAGRYLDAGEIV